jgi:benzodiazapine receptor
MTLLVCLLCAGATLGIGGALTEIGPWYFKLDSPPWKPPNWSFGIVWTVIGLCSAFGASSAWQAAPSAHRRIALVFGINAVLNILWSLFFFKLHRPDWALAEVVLLWLSVLALVVTLWPLHLGSGLLLLPYLVWVSVAALLNLSIVRRNAPFTTAGQITP